MRHPSAKFPALLEPETAGAHDQKSPRPPVRKAVRPGRRRRPALRRVVKLLLVAGALFLFGKPISRALLADPSVAFGPAADAVLVDREGVPLQVWPERADRRPIAFAELSPHLVDAILAREDQRFFSHFGVDPVGMARALRADLTERRIVQGGSTLTMQLVDKAYSYEENDVLDQLRAKVFEVVLALRLEGRAWIAEGERRAAKEAILAAYLGHVEFGNRTVGIREAAAYYFRKGPADLTLGESAYLAGVIRGPSVNNAHRDPGNARRARDAVVRNMEKMGSIGPGEGEAAKFFVSPAPGVRTRQGDGFLSAAVRRELEGLVAAGKVTATEASAAGLRLKLTRDSTAQRLAEEALFRQLERIEDDRKFSGKEGELQGAVVVLDNRSGAILASVGGRDFDRLAYDCALQGRRTAASVAKPFLYAAWLEKGDRHITDLVSNEALSGEEVSVLAAERSPEETVLLKSGTHPLWKGLAHSSNRMALRLGVKLPASDWTSLMQAARLRRESAAPTASTLLGSFDVRPVDLAAAYAVLPRGGLYAEPHLIREVEVGGRTVYRRDSRAHRILSSDTSDQVTAALRKVLEVGTASGHGGKALASKLPLAGKTGTSDGVYDAWFAGYGSEVTAVVWIGFPEGSRTILANATGGSLAFPVWKSIMEGLAKEFPFAPLAELPTEEPLSLTRAETTPIRN